MKIFFIWTLLVTFSFHLLFAKKAMIDPLNDSCLLKSVQIQGSTNINHFFFTYQSPLNSFRPLSPKPCVKASDILDFNIAVRDFKGNNPAMKKDFLELMREKDHPKVIVAFDKEAFSEITTESQQTYLKFHLTLAGVKRTIRAKCIANVTNDNRIVLSGTTEINLSDFSLTPPEKAFGLIRVKDLVIVKFDLIIKPTANKQA